MDYGQPANIDNQPGFFTAGAGTNEENRNDFEAENNLDLTNNQTDWVSQSERSNRNIGNTAISMPEQAEDREARLTPELPNLAEMGQIVNLEMPPGNEREENLTAGEIAEQALNFDKRKIKTGENLAVDGVNEVQAVINKLSQDGNTADFYDAAREMMEVNLDNSYNRKLAA